MGSNRLAHETSPYLLQHAHNPVDWYPWGEEALRRARNEDRPILLSIGYSACHWCHVMERESFENPEIAALMNRHFINIKVDREERPDLDHIYQTAVQLFIQRGGGWPLTMFLTPQLEPFYGGTYFPPTDRYNIPGFPRVLEAVAQAYRERGDEVRKTAEQARSILPKLSAFRPSTKTLSLEAVDGAVDNLKRLYDPIYGGFGGAPKFPSTMALDLMLRHAARTDRRDSLDPVLHTLMRMANGGIYDQLGGGFHRYSVDPEWLVPHFEKMLYDNALLLPLYLAAFQVTGEAFFARIARETADYLLREMLHPEGGFYSTQDADSEGEEGKFFVWAPEEVRAILGDTEAALFCRAFDVTPQGNFEGRNILHPVWSIETLAREAGVEPAEISRRIDISRRLLFEAREKRVKPFRDEKILTSWNGLALSTLARASAVLVEPQASAPVNRRYLEAAERTARFLLHKLVSGDRVLRVYKDGVAKLGGTLDDYAFLAEGLLDLYQVTFDPDYLRQATALARAMLERFWDADHTGFFLTPNDHEELIDRPKTGLDQSIPSGNAIAAMVLLRLSHLSDNAEFGQRAEQTLRLFYDALEEHPFGHAALLAALEFHLQGPDLLVVAGPRESQETWKLLRQFHQQYLPNGMVVLAEPEKEESLPAVARGKGMNQGSPAAYVCRGFTCSEPITDPVRLQSELARANPG